MKLSIHEFIEFHVNGRWKLLLSKGIFLLRKDLGKDWIDLYCIFGFYVEVFFDKKEITERLKYLSTTNKDKLEAKGKDREEIDFFAKFILCSNNEENFIQIDENEIRFWILKINPIKVENTEFLDNLISEIPHFLRFLIERPFSTEKKTRMWFSILMWLAD